MFIKYDGLKKLGIIKMNVTSLQLFKGMLHLLENLQTHYMCTQKKIYMLFLLQQRFKMSKVIKYSKKIIFLRNPSFFSNPAFLYSPMSRHSRLS